jgi:hypothetical protein
LDLFLLTDNWLLLIVFVSVGLAIWRYRAKMRFPTTRVEQKERNREAPDLAAPKDAEPESASEFERTHCPVCHWEIDTAVGKCMFCGADWSEERRNRKPGRMVVRTFVAVVKLAYVPAIYWASTIPVFTSWEQISPVYSKDPRLGLAHWYGALYGVTIPHPANAMLFLPVFALLWIIVLWPADVNPAGQIVNGVCTWILFFPVPLAILLLLNPSVASPIAEMVKATVRYLLF